jgi:hypothetical protein
MARQTKMPLIRQAPTNRRAPKDGGVAWSIRRWIALAPDDMGADGSFLYKLRANSFPGGFQR